MDINLQEAAQQCLNNGSRLTLKRKQILTILLIAQKAISAYELIDLYESHFDKKIPAMSTYRILAYLEKMHLVRKIQIANKFVACTKISEKGSHDLSQFMFCQQCQSVEEVPISASIYDELINKINKSGYQLCSQQIELSCLCNACSKNTSLPLQNMQTSI